MVLGWIKSKWLCETENKMYSIQTLYTSSHYILSEFLKIFQVVEQIIFEMIHKYSCCMCSHELAMRIMRQYEMCSYRIYYIKSAFVLLW